MRNKHPQHYTQQKLALDQHLLDTLKSLGIVASIADLNRQLLRNRTYFACMKNRGYSLHVGSLVFLLTKLSHELNAESCVRERAKLRSAIAAINETIQAKCRIREQELLAR